MTYRVEVIGKDSLSEIRYIGSSNDMSKMRKIIELDEFRDIANKIIHDNPKVTYDRAYVMAKNLRRKTPGLDDYQEELSNQEFERAKVKVLALNENAS